MAMVASKDVCNEDSLSQLFDANSNPIEGDYVQMLNQRKMSYDLRNRKTSGPFTTYTPLNNLNVPPDPNVSNNLSFSEVPMQYLIKVDQSKSEFSQIVEYVVKELKKIKVGISYFELLKVPEIRDAFFRSMHWTTQLKSSQDTTA